MIVIFAHKLADDIKTRLLAEIEKIRPGACVTVTQQTPDDTTAEILDKAEKIHVSTQITEDIILQNIPRILDNPPEPIMDKSGLSLEEKNARKYHTKNMTSRYNTVKQRYNKQKYHKTQNRIR
jgi:hypothetical protein